MSRRAKNEGSIRLRPDGRWEIVSIRALIKKGQPKRHYFYFKKQEDALKKKQEVEAQIAGGVFVEPNRMTVEQWLLTWFKDYFQPNHRESTASVYHDNIHLYLMPALGKAKIQQLRPDHIQSFINEQQAKAPSTVRKMIEVLSSALNQAIDNDLILTNPAKKAKLPKLEQKDIEFLTLEEQRKLLDAPTSDSSILENPTSAFPTLGKAMQSITNRSNTFPINKTAAANPNLSNPYPSNPPDGNKDRWIGLDGDGLAAADSFRETIKKRIEYDALAQDAYITKGRLDEIVDIMLEVLCATNPTMRIAGNEHPTSLVQERFRQITSKHIQYVFHCLNKNTSQVRNIKKYLLAVLFNAPATMDGYYAALINHDFGDIDLDAWDC